MNKNFLSPKAKSSIPFIIVMGLFAVVCVFAYFDRGFTPQNTTVFAFSYKYGFISRALLGTLWQGANVILPFDIMNYDAIYFFTKVITAVYFAVMLWFFYICLQECHVKDEKNMKYLACFYAVFGFPMFVTERNFGRIDVYLVILTIICCALIVKEKWEWLTIPITTFCVIMHHGYIFMYLNIILVLFFYKILMREHKRAKYITLLTVIFLIASVFFLYFEFFSHPEGEGIYEEIVALAKALSVDGQSIGESLINHEILGLDVFELEWKLHLMNYYETPLFVLFFMPYIVIGISFFIGLWKGKTCREKWSYFAVAVGIFTILPQMILKVDYGRYMFTFCFYYIVIIMCLIAMKDQHVILQLEETIASVKSIVPAAKILIVYPMIIMPFLDVEIASFFWIILGYLLQ